MADPNNGDGRDRWKKLKERLQWLSLSWTIFRVIRELLSHL
ncbi:hypothetical protein [Streptomyces sp. JJ38]|nr:hypothetical protein [Streptomyces sp. JJ38]